MLTDYVKLFQTLIGTVKSPNGFPPLALDCLVSNPHRYGQKKGGSHCLPRVARVSNPHRYGQKAWIDMSGSAEDARFQTLIGTVKRARGLVTWESRGVFQTLIGTVKSKGASPGDSGKKKFQTLIGTVKSLLHRPKLPLHLLVSNPHRYGQKMTRATTA